MENQISVFIRISMYYFILVLFLHFISGNKNNLSFHACQSMNSWEEMLCKIASLISKYVHFKIQEKGWWTGMLLNRAVFLLQNCFAQYLNIRTWKQSFACRAIGQLEICASQRQIMNLFDVSRVSGAKSNHLGLTRNGLNSAGLPHWVK